MAVVIHVDEKAGKRVSPADRLAGFTQIEILELIGCDAFGVLFLADGRRMAVKREFQDEAINEMASVLYQEGRNSSWAMRGTVLIGTREEIK